MEFNYVLKTLIKKQIELFSQLKSIGPVGIEPTLET